jgi:hypothetical protein
MVGNLQVLRVIPGLLSPVRNPLFIRFVSHKLLRVIAPFCFVAMLATTAALHAPFYRGLFIAQLALYLVGAVGLVVRARALSIPAAFVLVHAAVFAAVWRWRDDASQVWTPAPLPPRLDPVAIAHGASAPARDTLVASAVNITRSRATTDRSLPRV